MLPTSSRFATPALRRISAITASPRTRIRPPTSPRRRPFIAAAVAMPPKRKRAEPHPPPPPPPESSRRRTRRSKDAPELVLEQVADKPVHDTAALSNKADDVWASREAVARAMHDLSEMEQKLQDEVRRQRLAVESSDFAVDIEDAAKTALHISSKLALKEFIPEVARDPPGSKIVKPVAADELDGDQDVAAEDEDGQDRGARRLPPLNSEKLPLPWSGRLGYVRRIRGWSRRSLVSTRSCS